MTIEEAIKELKDASDHEVRHGDTEYHYNEVMKRVVAFGMAIKSLEAWEKVKAEIKDIKDLYDLGKEDVSTKMFLEGVETVEQIIERHLQEVST